METLELTDYAAMIPPFVAAVWSAWNTSEGKSFSKWGQAGNGEKP
jgi:hypothetical protein